MADIVTRLQAHNHVGQCAGCLHCEAAGEIKRLRAIEADIQRHLPGILSAARDYDCRLLYGIGSLPEWMYGPDFWLPDPREVD